MQVFCLQLIEPAPGRILVTYANERRQRRERAIFANSYFNGGRIAGVATRCKTCKLRGRVVRKLLQCFIFRVFSKLLQSFIFRVFTPGLQGRAFVFRDEQNFSSTVSL